MCIRDRSYTPEYTSAHGFIWWDTLTCSIFWLKLSWESREKWDHRHFVFRIVPILFADADQDSSNENNSQNEAATNPTTTPNTVPNTLWWYPTPSGQKCKDRWRVTMKAERSLLLRPELYTPAHQHIFFFKNTPTRTPTPPLTPPPPPSPPQ